MRRAALSAVTIVGLLAMLRMARAEPWTLTMDAGAEANWNVQRIETVAGSSRRIAAPVGQLGRGSSTRIAGSAARTRSAPGPRPHGRELKSTTRT